MQLRHLFVRSKHFIRKGTYKRGNIFNVEKYFNVYKLRPEKSQCTNVVLCSKNVTFLKKSLTSNDEISANFVQAIILGNISI
jgi:hypothetical protein